jgi:hypothetical protein
MKRKNVVLIFVGLILAIEAKKYVPELKEGMTNIRRKK